MITIVARNIIREGQRKAFLEAVRPLIAASRAEAGNLAYDLYADTEDENALCFIEKWQDMEAIAAHNASPHFQEWIARKSAFVASSTVARYKML